MFLRQMLVATTVAAGTVSGAMAADLPMRSAPPAYMAPVPVFTWTGLYAGVNAGAAFGNHGAALRPNFTTTETFGKSKDDVGFVGGAQIGYNWQNGAFVYGLEADADYLGLNNGGSYSQTSSVFVPNGTFSAKRDSGDGFLGTVRGRVGYAVIPRMLVYATGGLAYGQVGSNYTSASFTNLAGVTTANFTANGNDDIRIGYAVGGGVEYALTDRISAKAEYIYADLGKKNYTLTNVASGATFSGRSDGTAQLARVGLNYKF